MCRRLCPFCDTKFETLEALFYHLADEHSDIQANDIVRRILA